MFKMFSDKSRVSKKQHFQPLVSTGCGGVSSSIHQDPKEYQSSYCDCGNNRNHNQNQCESSLDTGLCSGSECCCSTHTSSSSSSSPINHIPSNTNFIDFSELTKIQIINHNNNNPNDNSKAFRSVVDGCRRFDTKTKMTDNETCSLVTEITSTMSSDECPDESLTFEHHHQPGRMADDDDQENHVDVEEEEEEVQWALVSKHDNFHLKINAEENYVCFIGTDNIDCHLLLRYENNNNNNHDNNSMTDGRQAVLIYSDGAFFLKDLASSFGTFVNERRVPSRCFVELNEHDEIRFGFSSDVYQIQRIVPSAAVAQQPINRHHHLNKQTSYSFDKHPAAEQQQLAVVDDTDCWTPPSSTTHPAKNKLSLFKTSFHTKLQEQRLNQAKVKKHDNINETNPKENMMMMIIKGKDDCVGNKTANPKSTNSKLSPSSFSLMSSSSNSSSTSASSSNTNNTSPSSVFKSAMKMMKMRFKKKSSSSSSSSSSSFKHHHNDSKSLICSGNDDITFIHYDHGHRHPNNNRNHVDKETIVAAQSVSAPESPNQPRSRVYHSHTYQNEYPHPRKFSAYQIGLSFDEEHEYDEVPRENDIETTTSCGSDQQSSTFDEQLMLKQETELCCPPYEKDDSTLCRTHRRTRMAMANQEQQNNKFYIDGDTFDANNKEQPVERQRSTAEDTINEAGQHQLHRRSPNSSSMKTSSPTMVARTMLPHLNSEDRLNNNSKLDVLIDHNDDQHHSLINKCEMDSSCPQPQQSVMMVILKDDDEKNKQYCSHHHHMPETIKEDLNMVDGNVGEHKDVTTTIGRPTFGSCNHNDKVVATNNVCNNNNNNISRCSDFNRRGGKVCQKEDSFFEKPTSNNNNVVTAASSLRGSDLVHSEIIQLDSRNDNDSDFDEYDIDDIGHLRRQPISTTTTVAVATVSRTVVDIDAGIRPGNVCDSLNCSTTIHTTLSPNNNDEHLPTSSTTSASTPPTHVITKPSSSSLTKPQHWPTEENDQENDRSRHSIGGMAFVIDFDDRDDKCTKSSMFNNENKRLTSFARNNSNKNNISRRHTFCERDKSSSPSSSKAFMESVDVGDGGGVDPPLQHQQKSVIRLSSKKTRNMIRKTLTNDDDDDDDDLESATSATMNSSPFPMRRSDTFDKKINKLTSETKPSEHQEESIAMMSNANNSKNSFQDLPSDTSSKASSSKPSKRIQPQQQQHGGSSSLTRNAKLSESAKWLIDRMFGDNDSYHHHGCYSLDGQEDSNQFVHCGVGDYYGDSHRSSGSNSPYGLRFNPPPSNEHIPTMVKSGNKTKISNSSSASTRMEYGDDSLSSLISTSDIVQRSSMSHLQSTCTVVPPSGSSDQSLPNFNKQQQVDSAIDDDDDDDDDLIADDISDTGTYVVEIDEQGHKHRKADCGATSINNDKPLDGDGQTQPTTKPNEFNEMVVRSSDEDLPGHDNNSYYDEDFHYDDHEEEEEDDEEDKLELARKQIDELFSNFEKKNQTQQEQQQQQQNGICPNTTNANNATYTRSKRNVTDGSLDTINHNHRDRQQHQNSFNQRKTMVVNDKCPPISFDSPGRNRSSSTSSDAVTYADKSKKRISSELMSAFKKINSKLEKTARLGNLSLVASGGGGGGGGGDGENSNSSSNNHGSMKNENNLPSSSINAKCRYPPSISSPKTLAAVSNLKPPLKCRSAPVTPNLSSVENRKIYRQEKRSAQFSRKSSLASSSNECSSNEKLDDQSLKSFGDNSRQSRARSESITSNNSNQSSNLRFNRAFALRRARLGMDTCGVEISEQAAFKAKESQEKYAPKKAPISSPFRRNDGGRFSLRAPQNASQRIARPVANIDKPSATNTTRACSFRKCSKLPPTITSAATTTKIPAMKSHSTSSSVCSSSENLCKTSAFANHRMNESRVIRKRTTDKLPSSNKNNGQILHSDNEIILDATGGNAVGANESCDESSAPVSSLSNRFGRSSLRGSSLTAANIGNSSTPWLKSLKANVSNTATTTVKHTMTQSPNAAHPMANFNRIQSSYPCEKVPSNEMLDSSADNNMVRPNQPTTPPMSGFQIGKRLFMMKPHRMAQFDKDFNGMIGRSASANSRPTVPDPNLMTHSVTESLLSRNNMANNLAIPHSDNKAQEHPQTSAISPSINARIFSISPLDSLVISAINQLSSKLRTRMRNFLERERSNHVMGSEARSLIDEILPQITNVGCSDSRSNQSKSAFNHESSNISRDLSNILKNLKKVEQIFDVFYMLQEPNVNCQEISGGEQDNNSVTNSPIITNASDSETSGGSETNCGNIQTTPTKQSVPKKHGFRFVPTSDNYHHQPQQNVQSPPSSSQTNRSGFFIEI